MPVLLVKGLRYGLGMASEVIHARRDQKSAQPKTEQFEPDGTAHASYTAHVPADAESHDDATKGHSHVGPSHGNDIHQDETAWQLHEINQRFQSSGSPAIAYENANIEENKVKERVAMTRELLNMAGPPPETQPVHPLVCPVIIPQRRARQRDRGFVPAYSPVLQNCGISQEVFLRFIEDLNTVNRCDGGLEAIFVAAQVVGALPFGAAHIIGAVAAVVAGTAKEFQMRHRKNSFLEMVNNDMLRPRGLCAIIMTFKDGVRGQNFGLLNQLFAKEEVGPDETGDMTPLSRADARALSIDKAAARVGISDPEESRFKKKWRDMSKLSSGKTYGEVELPENAPLLYPDLERAAAQACNGEMVREGVLGKVRAAGEWTEEYKDRRANVFYAAKHPDTKMVRPIQDQKPLKSRFNDPNHPANSGSLISLVSGGTIAVPGVDKVLGQGRRMAVNLVQGKKPTEGAEPIDGLGSAMLKKITTQDVLYLMVVNLPTQEELQESVAELENIMHKAGYTEQATSNVTSY